MNFVLKPLIIPVCSISIHTTSTFVTYVRGTLLLLLQFFCTDFYNTVLRFVLKVNIDSCLFLYLIDKEERKQVLMFNFCIFYIEYF